MDLETLIAVIAAGIGVLATVVIVVLLARGVISLTQIRDALRQPARPKNGSRD